MKMIDPTYLRTIYDGLHSGAMHKDNASTLPIGLIGIYEEALPPSSNVNERKKFLEFFAVWALLKKEVSAEFVVALLEGWTEEHVLDYISKYSKWFNSPVSGKYTLYHERLRSFVFKRIADITRRNEIILKKLLLKETNQVEKQNETKQYLQEYYGDHLAISAYYKNDDLDEYYIKLKEIDQFIAQQNWIVKDLDRRRWNEFSGILASIDGDVDFLKELILSQDRILNKDINLEGLLKNIIRKEFDDLDDILINSDDNDFKHLLILNLIFSLIQILKTKYRCELSLVFCLNLLIKRLNELSRTESWIIHVTILDNLNGELRTIGDRFKYDINLIDKSKYYTNCEGSKLKEFDARNGFHLKSEIFDLINHISDIESLLLEDKKSLEIRIKKDLIYFINEVILPDYEGDVAKLESLIQRIKQYQIVNDENQEIIIDIISLIKEASGLTGYVDTIEYYNEMILQLIVPFILDKNLKSNIFWIRSFAGSAEYTELINFYKVFGATINQIDLNVDYIKSIVSNRRQFLNYILVIVNILIYKQAHTKAYELYRISIDHYLNYNDIPYKYVFYSKFITKKEISDSDLELLLMAYKKLEYRHIPTIAYCLCRKFNILEIIYLLNDDNTFYSDVAANKLLINEILNGIVEAKGLTATQQFLLDGLEKYISVMGKYNADEYNQEDNRPGDNIWKIEWWVMGNVIYCFHLLVENYFDSYLADIYSDNYGNIDLELYYVKIEELFTRFGYNSNDNLYLCINKYMEIGPTSNAITSEIILMNILFEYHTNKMKSLLKFNKISHNRFHINSLAAAIRSEYSA